MPPGQAVISKEILHPQASPPKKKAHESLTDLIDLLSLGSCIFWSACSDEHITPRRDTGLLDLTLHLLFFISSAAQYNKLYYQVRG